MIKSRQVTKGGNKMNAHPKNVMLFDVVKSYIDYFKHITTLNTGSILIIIALLEGVFKKPKALYLIGISVFSFVISLVCSLIIMKKWLNYAELMIGYVFTDWERNRELFEEKIKSSIPSRKKLATWIILGFLLGVLSLLGFTAMNLFSHEKIIEIVMKPLMTTIHV